MRRLPWFVMALVLAAGCGGSSGGPRTLDPAPSASPSPSPSPSLSPEEQVLAAVRAYYAAVTRASDTGDVAPLEALSAPQCDCRKLSKAIAKTYADGNKVVGGNESVSRLAVRSLQPPAAVVNGTVTISAHDVVMKDGGRKHAASDEFPVEILLGYRVGKWLILSVREA